MHYMICLRKPLRKKKIWTWRLQTKLLFTQERWVKRWGAHDWESLKQGQSVLPTQSLQTEKQVHKCIPRGSSDSQHPLIQPCSLPHLGKCESHWLEMNQTTHLGAPCTVVADCFQDHCPDMLIWFSHLCHSVQISERKHVVLK